MLIHQLRHVAMSSALVGYENVPNVYITDIFLDNNSTNSFAVNLGLELCDYSDSSWFLNGDYNQYLKVGFIKTSNPTLQKQLADGIINPHPLSIIKTPEFDFTSDIKVYPLVEFAKKTKITQTKFKKRIKFLVENDTRSLAVFAYCFLDTQQISADYKLDLTGILKNYTGALVGDQIIREGEVVSTTNLFLKDNNVVWTGPVHVHDGTYMEGSFHSSAPHGALRKILINNYKLVDNRKPTFGPRVDRISKDDIYFSDLYYSVNDQVDLWGIFSFNLKQFAIQKTKHGRKLHSLNNSFFQEYLSTIQVNSLEVTRQQIKLTTSYNKVGSLVNSSHPIGEKEVIGISVDNEEGNLKGHANLREIYMDPNPLIRHFQFFDQKQTAASKGIFRYTAKITFVDKTQEFLNRKIQTMRGNLNDLKRFVFFYNSPSRYDYYEDKLKPGIEMTADIIKILKGFYEDKSLLENISTSEANNLIDQDIKRFLTANYRSITGTKIVNEYQSLFTSFLRKFNVTNDQKVGRDKPKTNKCATIPNLISMTKEFEPIIDFEEYRRFYDFLNIKKDIKSNITKQEFLNRGGMEIDRFFDTNKSMDFPEFKVVEPKTRGAIRNLQKPKSKFFSPLRFHFEGEKVDLKQPDKIDTRRLFDLFKKSNKRQESKRTFRDRISRTFKKKTEIETNRFDKNKSKLFLPQANQRKNQFNFKLKKADRTIQQIQKQYNIGSNIYLGNNSEFPFVEGRSKPALKNRFEETLQQSLEASLDLSFPRSKNKFDVSIPRNILDDFSKRKKNSISILENAPVSWKALVLSRSPAAKNNILEEDVDILQDSNAKVATEMIFQTTQVVEVLVGYKRDVLGTHMLSQPIWKEFDEKYLIENHAIICRLRYLEMPEIGITPLEMFKIPIVNSTFIICDRHLRSDITTEIFSPYDNVATNGKIDSKNEISKNIKYANSIIIKQNINKDAFKRNEVIPAGIEETNTLMIPSDEIKQGAKKQSSNRRRTTSSSRMLSPTNTSDGPAGGGTTGGGY